MITENEIRKIAELARLEINEEEVARYAEQMSNIVGYVQQLDELDTTDIEIAAGGLTPEGEATDNARPDEARPSLGQQTALAEAPDAAAGHFRVPKVL